MRVCRGIVPTLAALTALPPLHTLARQPEPRLTAKLEQVRYWSTQDFSPPEGISFPVDHLGTAIFPEIVVTPSLPAPILSRRPRIRLDLVRGPDGRNLIAPDTGTVESEHSRETLPRFAFPSPAESPFAPFHYNQSVRAWGTQLILPRLPRYIDEISGVVETDVVTEELYEDIDMSSRSAPIEVTRGVTLSIIPSESSFKPPTLVCDIDREDRPYLNMIAQETNMGVKSIPLVPDPDNPKRLTGPLFVAAGKAPRLTVHLVFKFETIQTPFRLFNAPVANSPSSAAPTATQSRQFRAGADGFELWLTRLLIHGEDRFDYAPSETRSALLTFALVDRSTDRKSNHSFDVDLSDLTDDVGKPVGQIRTSRTAGSYGEAGVMISDPAAYKKPAARDPLVQTRVVSLTMDRFPGRFGSVVGKATVAEIIRDLHIDVPLGQAQTTTVAPGVRVVVGPPKPPAGEAPRERFAIELDLPPESQFQDAHKAVPWLKAIELVDSAGAPIGFDCKFELQRTERGAVAKIRREMIPYQTAAARVHLVLEAREHTVPFDFRNVPCLDP